MAITKRDLFHLICGILSILFILGGLYFSIKSEQRFKGENYGTDKK